MVPPWAYPLLLPISAGFIVWLRTQYRYRITHHHLEVILWGIPVRRFALRDISQVTIRHRVWAEHWWNTWRPARRRLLIQRRRGWCRYVVLTPQRRYEFKTELERAVTAAAQPEPALAPGDPAPDVKPSA
jgi:hypothetical protein